MGWVGVVMSEYIPFCEVCSHIKVAAESNLRVNSEAGDPHWPGFTPYVLSTSGYQSEGGKGYPGGL